MAVINEIKEEYEELIEDKYREQIDEQENAVLETEKDLKMTLD